MFNEIAEGIYSVDTRFVDGTNGLIFTSSGAVALDVGFYPDTGEAMADFIRARGHTPDRVVLTHGHSDHVLGGAAFRGADVFGNMGTADQARNQLAAFARRFDKDYDELMTQALLPNITFSGDLLLDMGDRTLRLFPTPGHSPDHISLYIAPERILFAGDTVVTGIVPAIGDGDSRVLEATLRGLLALDMDVLVAGHGPALHGQPAIREWIQWEIDYLAGMRSAIEGASAGGPAPTRDFLAELLPFDTWVGARLPRDRNHMERRHVDTAAKIAAELAAQPEAV